MDFLKLEFKRYKSPEIKLVDLIDTYPRGHNSFKQGRDSFEKENCTRHEDVSSSGSTQARDADQLILRLLL